MTGPRAWRGRPRPSAPPASLTTPTRHVWRAAFACSLRAARHRSQGGRASNRTPSLPPSLPPTPRQDVRLYTACSVAEILRIYAPEAPFSSPILLVRAFPPFHSMHSLTPRHQSRSPIPPHTYTNLLPPLQQAFALITAQLRGLATITGKQAAAQGHKLPVLYLLHSLATVRAFVIAAVSPSPAPPSGCTVDGGRAAPIGPPISLLIPPTPTPCLNINRSSRASS